MAIVDMDFTESEYRRIVAKARDKADIISYDAFLSGNYNSSTTNIIWRHDIDCSVHRAVRMAEIEAEEGISSIYFVLFSSFFYNVFESEIIERIKRIISLGHEIGIHLDMSLFSDVPDLVRIENDLQFLGRIIEYLFGVTPKCFSFHNPTKEILDCFTDEYIGGYINAYCKKVMDSVAYCSDSNGYWRYQRLSDFLDRTDFTVGCVLTHPIWWPPEKMSPRARIQRAIDGKSDYVGSLYDFLLEKYHRNNIK